MTRSAPPFAYRVFDRYLISDIPLQLLPLQKDVPQGAPILRIILSQQIRQPDGDVVWEPRPLGFHTLKTADSYLMVFPRIGWFADIDDRSFTITMYPMSDGPETFTDITLRSLGDRAVTSLLSRYPQRWGMASVHGALLVKGARAITLLGRSGAGKSTLSQVLAREYGWHILDDDTFGFFPEVGSKTVWPMGSYPRIRQGALAFFDAKGPELPGYQGGKMFLPDSNEAPGNSLPQGVELSHAFILNPRDDDDESPAQEPASFIALEPQGAIKPLLSRVMALGLVNDDFSRLQFLASTWLARITCTSLAYRHFLDQPTQIASGIDDIAEKK